MSKACIYPGCEMPATVNVFSFEDGDILWCSGHAGLYPHKCLEAGCDRRVIYDDEPKCFTHSPDEGSSVRGWSAYAEREWITILT